MVQTLTTDKTDKRGKVMKSFEFTVKDPVGIHARPAGNLVKEIKALEGVKVTLAKGEKSVDATRLMSVMGLGVKSGETVTFTVEGENEEAVAQKLSSWLEANL